MPHIRRRAIISGAAKKGRKTKMLTERLRPGDIAVIDHTDLDEVAADSLCKQKVNAVINVSSSITGQYPNKGPGRLSLARIRHLDELGAEFYDLVEDGERLTIRDECIYRGTRLLGRGRLVDEALIGRNLSLAEENLAFLLDGFVQNTLEYALKEKEIILGGLSFPHLLAEISGRHVLVVVRGQSYREDLPAIKHYLDDLKPVLIGVDGGADALLEFGCRPDIIVGDMDSVSDHALYCAKERVVHAYTDGRAPGLARLQKLGLPAVIVEAPGTSEDIAMLLAYEKGARLIVAVGTHSHMIDFLEKGRKGMASTFLVRLKVGGRLVDARGVSQLYRGNVSGRSVALLALAAAIPAVALTLANPAIRHIFRLLYLRLGIGL